MKLKVIQVGLLIAGLSATILAQSPPPNAAGQGDASRTAEDKPVGQRMAENGGSLLRAQLATANQGAPGLPASDEPTLGSLKDVSPFAVPEPKPRFMRKHDLVTVIIRDESSFKAEGKSDVKREAEFKAILNQLVRFNMNNGLNLENTIGGTKPEIDINGSRSFKGDAKLDRSDSLTARVQGEIIDVKPNGTLVVQSRTRVKVDEEEKVIIISGTCRAEDITPDNTVLSTQMNDLNIDQQHKGSISSGTKRGWFHKLLDGLNPF